MRICGRLGRGMPGMPTLGMEKRGMEMLGMPTRGIETLGMETCGIFGMETSGMATRGIFGIVSDDMSGRGIASLQPVCTISGEYSSAYVRLLIDRAAAVHSANKRFISDPSLLMDAVIGGKQVQPISRVMQKTVVKPAFVARPANGLIRSDHQDVIGGRIVTTPPESSAEFACPERIRASGIHSSRTSRITGAGWPGFPPCPVVNPCADDLTAHGLSQAAGSLRGGGQQCRERSCGRKAVHCDAR